MDRYLEPTEEVKINPEEMKPAPEMTKEERRNQTDKYTMYKGYVRKTRPRFNSIQKKKVDGWVKKYGLKLTDEMTFDDISFEVFKLKEQLRRQDPVAVRRQKKLEIRNQSFQFRYEKIMQLRRELKTLEEIGKELGITRERTRQLVLKFSQEDQLEFFKLGKEVPRKGNIKRGQFVTCRCGIQFYVTPSSANIRKSCSRNCILRDTQYRFPVPNEIRKGMTKYEKANYRYQHYPEYKKLQNKRTYACLKKRMGTPEGRSIVVAKQKVYAKTWMDKIKADPVRFAEYKAKMKKASLEQFEKLKADPVKFEEYKAKRRQFWRNRIERKRLLQNEEKRI